MKLIFCGSHGSSYQKKLDEAILAIEAETALWLKRDNITVSKQTKFFIHVMVTAEFSNFKEVFDHNLSKKDARQYFLDITEYHCAGWKQYWVTR